MISHLNFQITPRIWIELSKCLKTGRHSPHWLVSEVKSSDMDLDSNHGELGDKYENQSPSTSMAPVRVVEHSVVPGGWFPTLGEGSSSCRMIKLSAMTRTHQGQAESFPCGCAQALWITKKQLIYEATLRRAVLYGIHIQGTVIGNHIAWEPRCPFGEDLAGI